MMGASFLVLLMGLDPALFGSSVAAYNRIDGIVLLVLFAGFLAYTGGKVRKDRSAEALVEEMAGTPDESAGTIFGSLAKTVVGMAALLYGGHLTVEAAVDLARAIHVPEFIIGLTLVAIGTSLPELATCVIAAYRRHSDLAVGNVVGSNLFNLLFVLGVTSTVHPVGVPTGGLADLLVMTALAVILLPVALTSQSRITRFEGAGLLTAYLGYLLWRTLFSA
jgi:cation:H+ antiporter